MSANYVYLEIAWWKQSISSGKSNVTEPSKPPSPCLLIDHLEKLFMDENVYNSQFLKSYRMRAKKYSWTLFFPYPKINLLE